MNVDGITIDNFRHGALFYRGENEFLEGTLSFIREGIEASELTVVLLKPTKNEAVRSALGDEADAVIFADMSTIGHNPAQIIPMWQRFVMSGASDDRRLRGVGEPIDVDRDEAELVECHRHEALVNIAFAGRPFSLLCSYDVDSLPTSTIAAAKQRHEFIFSIGSVSLSNEFVETGEVHSLLSDPLTDPLGVDWQKFGVLNLATVRENVRAAAHARGLSAERAAELALAVNEITSNSIIHGSGSGIIGIWHESDRILCEVRDEGHFSSFLADRTEPDTSSHGGRGLWLTNKLCDLVQIRSGPAGTSIRVHLRVS